MSAPFPRVGLYAVTDAGLCARHGGIAASVRLALEGGACAVQYRDKSNDAARREDEAGAVVALCREFGAFSIINDDVDLALRCGASGVHVGRDDSAAQTARARLGAAAHVGVSCYADLARMRSGLEAGASYVAFGAAFVSRTKPGAAPLPRAVLRSAAKQTSAPIVVIGGITAANAAEIVATGVRTLAVISALFGARDVRTAARELVAAASGGAARQA